MLTLKRIYEAPAAGDGARILIDRLWPRGVRREDAHLSAWMKDVAPGNELRKWFHADRSRWAEFRDRYRAELAGNHAAVEQLCALLQKGDVTLVYAARDPVHNHAVVLAEYLHEHCR